MDMTNKNIFDSNSIYDRVNKVEVQKNLFDTSYVYSARFDPGQLIPFYYQPTIPGGSYKISNEFVLRTDPLLKPIFANMKMRTFYFFVPYRLLMGTSEYVYDDEDKITEITYENDDRAFETFITGGVHGDGKLKGRTVTLPLWSKVQVPVVNDNWNGIESVFPGSNKDHVNVSVTSHGKYSLWSYFGLPDDVYPQDVDVTSIDTVRPYNLIYNYFFRNKDLQLENDIDSLKVMNCNWNKDYFTSANYDITRSPAPQLPVEIKTLLDFSAIGNIPIRTTNNKFGAIQPSTQQILHVKAKAPIDSTTLKDLDTFVCMSEDTTDSFVLSLKEKGYSENDIDYEWLTYTDSQGNERGYDSYLSKGLLKQELDRTVATSSSFGFNVTDLRVALTIQQWLETNMRSGYLYKPFLESHFGISPTDDRLQEPEYIGGSTSNIIISEVVQTSATNEDSVQGNLAGNGLTAGQNYIADYLSKEYGVIIGLCCVKPDAQYSQGIDRNFLRTQKFSFFFPEFQGLSEQSLSVIELYAQNNGNVDSNGDLKIFGYQGRFNEFRARTNIVGPGLRNEYSYWTTQRKFFSEPKLNGEFIKCRPSKDIFEVQDEPTLSLLIGNLVKSYLPMEPVAVPGLKRV